MASVPFCKSHKSSLDTFSEKFDQAVGKNILSSEKVNIFYKPFAHFKLSIFLFLRSIYRIFTL